MRAEQLTFFFEAMSRAAGDEDQLIDYSSRWIYQSGGFYDLPCHGEILIERSTGRFFEVRGKSGKAKVLRKVMRFRHGVFCPELDFPAVIAFPSPENYVTVRRRIPNG